MLMNLNARREIRTVNMGAKIGETYLPGFFIGLQKNTVLEGLFCMLISRNSVSHRVERRNMYDFRTRIR